MKIKNALGMLTVNPFFMVKFKDIVSIYKRIERPLFHCVFLFHCNGGILALK